MPNAHAITIRLYVLSCLACAFFFFTITGFAKTRKFVVFVYCLRYTMKQINSIDLKIREITKKKKKLQLCLHT